MKCQDSSIKLAIDGAGIETNPISAPLCNPY